MSGRWTAALDDFEARVTRVEDCLERGDFEALPGEWAPPADVAESPSRAQRARADALLARARAAEHRLALTLHAVAGELHALRARTDAATSYHDHAAGELSPR